MPMVFHSRHSPMGVPVTMEDGQIPHTVAISENGSIDKKDMMINPANVESGDKRLIKSHVVDKVEDLPLAEAGLLKPTPLFILFMWYFFSAVTLFLNKYLLVTLNADAILLATMQMVITTLLGLFNMHFPCRMYRPIQREGGRPPNFYRNMALVGITRFLVVFLGLVALKYVAVSFTETVKSSAPLFTVLMSRMMLGEKNGAYVMCSLIPIMSGLALCSAYELSFNIEGFIAALGTNISECLQFVLSKLYISNDKYKVTPAEFQFYTCFASCILQTPVCLLLADYNAVMNTDMYVMMLMIINGISYHFQTMMAWVLMSFVSPVTHSVCNTVKRAILIWLSVLIFGNPVTFLSGFGTCVVTVGVLLYNKARDIEQSKRNLMVRYEANHKEIQKL